ncbi:hypothetical protein BJ742DRAFT_868964 [Cladochytrium replicatum]|nr:hypothetical protein BJ742DRAFT_868964 [Cladochytrium replicatum]
MSSSSDTAACHNSSIASIVTSAWAYTSASSGKLQFPLELLGSTYHESLSTKALSNVRRGCVWIIKLARSIKMNSATFRQPREGTRKVNTFCLPLPNRLTHKVLVSPKFQLQSELLAQVRENRLGLQIRRDHWVPFAVLSGISNQSPCDSMFNQLLPESMSTNKNLVPFPGPKYTLPIQNSLGHTWKVPQAVEDTVVKLCQVLTRLPKSDVCGGTTRASRDAAVDEVDGNKLEERRFLPKMSEEGKPRFLLWWGREEYKTVVYKNDLEWPDYAKHAQMELIRARYPNVPGIREELKGIKANFDVRKFIG